MSKEINSTYPELVEDWEDVVEVELRGVIDELKDAPEEEGTHCMIDDENPEWFSVYARHKDGCSTCISDHGVFGEGQKFLTRILTKHPHVLLGVHTLKTEGSDE